MKRRKNILAVLLAVTVMATAMPGSAIAAPVDGQTTEVSAKAGTEKAEKKEQIRVISITDPKLEKGSFARGTKVKDMKLPDKLSARGYKEKDSKKAEDIKIKIGSAYKRPEPDYMEVRGRNLVTGLPKTIKVSSEETEEALKESTMQIVEAIHGVLEKTPPELAADIADRGIVLTGGGSLLRGLEELIAEHTGINTMTAEDPMTAVAIGTGKYVEFLGGYRE